MYEVSVLRACLGRICGYFCPRGFFRPMFEQSGLNAAPCFLIMTTARCASLLFFFFYDGAFLSLEQLDVPAGLVRPSRPAACLRPIFRRTGKRRPPSRIAPTSRIAGPWRNRHLCPFLSRLPTAPCRHDCSPNGSESVRRTPRHGEIKERTRRHQIIEILVLFCPLSE